MSRIRDFVAARDRVGRLLEELRDLAAASEFPGLAEEAGEALERLRESRFHLAVMGQFKRGKSTLINALLGEPLLPTGVLPLTSIATEIRYGPARRAEVFFEDGRREVVPVDDLALYVTEKHNPGNRKGVARVEVDVPNPLLGGGLVITDTPGIGSTYAHNTQAAHDYLERADAAILIFGVDPPASEVELDFVDRARGYLDRLFFLLNKVDFASAEEAREALEFTRQALADRLGGDPVEVRPVSAKLALEGKVERDPERVERSGLPAFEAELGTFISRSKAQAVVGAAARRGLRLAREIEGQLAAQEAALRLPLAEIDGVSAALAAALEQGRAKHREILFVLAGEMKELERELDEEVDSFRMRETASLGRRAGEFLESSAGLPVAELARKLEDFRSGLLVADFEGWRRELEGKLDRRLREIGERFESETLALIDEVRRRASDLLRVRLPSVAESGRLAAETRLWYVTGDISKPFMPEVNLLTFSAILPRAVVLGRLRRDLARSVAEEVDRNCGRVRYDVLVRLEEAGRRLKASLEHRFESTMDSLVRGLERAAEARRTGGERVEETLRRTGRFLGEARRIAADLEEFTRSL